MFAIDKQKTSENLLYILVWGAIFFVPLLNTAMTSKTEIFVDDVLAAWIKTAPFFTIFAINNNLFAPLLLFNRRFIIYLASVIIVTLLTFVGVDYIQDNIMSRFIAHRVAPNMLPGDISITDLNIFWNVIIALMMCVANDGIKLIYKSMRDDQLMEELKRQNLQVEMDYLKYQINPHFFMNTLNNIHALIDIDSDSAKSAVIELSKMMRYILYESGNESISLDTDFKFISNYIELMRIRYEENIEIRVNRSNDLPKAAAIPPLMLIVFIENAFKHGASATLNRCFISIDIQYDAPYLHYCVTNNIPTQKTSPKSSGIGLINLRKRLELVYDDKFCMSCKQEDDKYIAELKIPIKNGENNRNR